MALSNIYGKKRKDGTVEINPTLSAVSNLPLTSNGLVSLPVGGGYFVQFFGHEARKVNDQLIAGWRRGVPSSRPVKKEKEA